MQQHDDQLPSLELLQIKIAQAKSLADKEADDDIAVTSAKSAGNTMELATGLFIGAGVGGAIGYGIDRWLNSSPIGLIIGFFLGFATGLMNLMQRIK